MPYQPTNPYPYNTGVDLQDGLKFNFRVDNYDTINKFKLELYDLLRNEKVYTIIRTVGDISGGEIVEGDNQLIQILDANDEQIYLDIYKIDDTGVLNVNNQLPISGGNGEASICELQVSQYIASIELIERKKYYPNIQNFESLVIKPEWFLINENTHYIKEYIGPKTSSDGVLDELVVPYKINGFVVEGINEGIFQNYNGDGSFKNKKIIIPSSVFSIGDGCFENAQIEEVLFNSGNSKLGNSVFKNSAITEITLLDTISEIGDSAFEKCNNLITVNLSHTLEVIPYKAFSECQKLNDIKFLSNIKRIDNEAFNGCQNFKEVRCPEGLKEIGHKAFANCSHVIKVYLPDSVTEIGSMIFMNDMNIIEMTVPFIGRNRLTNKDEIVKTNEYLLSYFFEYNDNNTAWIKQEYNNKQSYIYGNIPTFLKKITITDSSIISYGAFYNCNMLWEVILNDKLLVVQDYAFFNCINLIQFTVPKNIEKLGKYMLSVEVIDNQQGGGI